MKFFILLAALAAVAFADDSISSAQYQLHIPDKCEDVLAVKVCERLRITGATLKLKSEEVKKGALDAYAKGKKTAVEIEAAINDFMINQVLTKRCEDFTSAEVCSKLRKLAEDAKIQTEKIQKYVMEQVAILKSKPCVEYLDVEKCQKINDLVAKLKMKVEQKKDILIAAYLEAKANATQHMVETYNKIKHYVMATKCEDMFNPDLCKSFRKYAEKTKVGLPRVMETAFSLLKKGMSVGKALIEKVYDIVDYFYDCEDIFDDSSCVRIKNWAAKLKVTAEQVEVLVRQYVRVFLEKSTSVYQTIKKFVKERIYCHFKTCSPGSDDDDVAFSISKRGATIGEWKDLILELLKQNYPHNTFRSIIESMVKSANSKWEFMVKLAKAIKNKSSQFPKYVEFLKNFMADATFVF